MITVALVFVGHLFHHQSTPTPTVDAGALDRAR
jgi:hypothetical protein